MSQNIGTLITSAIRPNDTLDPIASAYANEIKGGLHGYATLLERNNLIAERREWGMLVVVYADISNSNNKTYQLQYGYADADILNNSNWVEYTGNSTSVFNEWQNSVISILLVEPTSPNDGDRYLVGTNISDVITGINWSLETPAGFITQYNSSILKWEFIYPTNGTTLRVDDQDNSVYKYEGEYPTGEWFKERFNQVYSVNFTGNGLSYTTTTTPITYEKDIIFLSKFDTMNSGSITININGLGIVNVKKPSNNGLVDLLPNDIQPDNIYSLVYDGTYFQFTKTYSNDAYNIKYYVEPTDFIVVPPFCQYWVYGDLTVDGTILNYGQIIVANGELKVGSGTVSNYGNIDLVTIGINNGTAVVFGGDLLPSITNTFDIGVTGSTWRDLHLSGSTIYLGDTTIKSIDNNVIIENIIVGGATASGGVLISATAGVLTVNGVEVVNNYDVNVVIVKKGYITYDEFSSIKLAVDSITTASDSNPFIIKVGPGVYIEDTIDLTTKPYISIVGSSIDSVIIEPINSTTTVFNLGTNNEISFLTVRNTGYGIPAVKVYNNGDYTVMHKISFHNCDIGIDVFADSTDTEFYGEYIDFNGTYSYGVRIIAENGFKSYANLENYYNLPVGGSSTIGTFISGSGAEVDILTSGFKGEGNGIGIYLEDGALVDIVGSFITNWNNAIQMANVGTFSTLKCNGIKLLESVSYDLLIEHPDAQGEIFAAIKYEKLSIPKLAPFYVVNRDINLITVSKKGGDFTSVKAAVDSISDASITNGYTINIGPGDFVEDTIIMKPFVDIRGSRVTRVSPSTNTQHIFMGSDDSAVSGITVTGAGVGFAAFYHTSSTGTEQTAFILKDIIFGNNDTHVICYADSNRTTVQVIDSRYGDHFEFDKGFYAYNNDNSTAARILLLHCYSQGMATIKPTYFAKASGINCEIVMNSVQANASAIQLGSSFLIIENGAKVRLNAVNFTAWDYGIWNPTTGLDMASNIIGVAVSCQNTNNHILIQHPDTIGNLNGSFEKSRVTTLSDKVSIVYSDSAIGDFTISGGLNITYSPTVTTDVSTLLAQSSTMGVIEGGIISNGGGLTVSVTEGHGYYHINGVSFGDKGILHRLDWANTSLGITSNSTQYVYFDSNGILKSDPTIPSTSENILLGRVRTNLTGFEFIEKTPASAEHWANKTTKLLRKGIGPVYSNGSIVTENVISLHLDVSPGIYYFGSNEFTPSGGTGITFSTYHPDGIGGWIISSTNSVDNNYYAGTSSLIGLSASWYTKHSLYLSGDNSEERYFMVYDTNQYDDILPAQVATIPTPPSYFSDAVTLIAGIIVQQGNPVIKQVRDQRPVIGFRAPAINASADHSSLLNLTNDDHHQYLLTNGARALTGNLIMGSNSITGVDLINSVNITSHASRHLPGGSDALTTGTPSSIGTFSQIGGINAFARQDHIHAHDNQPGGSLHATASITTAGFMSSTDKVILDNITSLTQSLTNKTIIGSTNYVDSDGLKTNTFPVFTGGATAPSIDQVLMAISATAATWQTPSNVTATQSGYMSFIDKNILDNITSSTQSLTNKIIVGSTNYVDSDGLKTNTFPVFTGGATAPSINQVLMAISATAATWQTPSNTTATQSGYMSFTDKNILDNITSSTQSLTNKTIVGSTNYVDANGLKTTTTPVYTGAAVSPSINQVLMAISATAATWQTPSNVTATQSGYMSFTDKNILDNITSSTQSLTNKTIIGSTNYVDANGLKTTTTPVYIAGSSAPSIGQRLVAISATAATWQTPQKVSIQVTPVDPTTTNSTVGVMMGIGASASITPTFTGKLMIIISGDIDNDTGDNGSQVQIRTGTGTPPINGAALTGTTRGGLVKMIVIASGGATNITRVPFSLNTIISGLTLNTTLWIDISLASITGGVSRVRDISVSVVEL